MKGNGRGRPKKPIKQRVLEGSAPLYAALPENQLEGAVFNCPSYFIAEAIAVFDRLLPHMRRAGYEKQIYYDNYCAMCQAAGFAQAAAKTITTGNMLEVDEQGVTRKNPAFQVIKDQMVIFNTIASKFGMSPADRAKIGAEMEAPKKGGILSIIARSNNQIYRKA